MEIDRLTGAIGGVLEIGKERPFHEIREEALRIGESERRLREDIIYNLLKPSSSPQAWGAMCFAAIDWAEQVDPVVAEATIAELTSYPHRHGIRLMSYELSDKKGYVLLKTDATEESIEQQKPMKCILVFEEETGETKDSPTPVTVGGVAISSEKESSTGLIYYLARDPESFNQLLNVFLSLYENTVKVSAPVIGEAVRKSLESKEKRQNSFSETRQLDQAIENLLKTLP